MLLKLQVGGRLRCIGSPQHLKTRFGNHLELEVNFSSSRVFCFSGRKDHLSKLMMLAVLQIGQTQRSEPCGLGEPLPDDSAVAV